MKLPSGRMCSVTETAGGKIITSVSPATSPLETVEILEEWIHVNPGDPLIPGLIVQLSAWMDAWGDEVTFPNTGARG